MARAVHMHIDQFEDLRAPAHARAMELEAEVKDAECELENLIRSVNYDDAETEAAQLRLEDRKSELERWGRRHRFLEGVFSGKDASDHVTIEIEEE